MTIPFSSSLPDPVQKVLGLQGGAGEVEKAILGATACALAVWGLLKLIKTIGQRKP